MFVKIPLQQCQKFCLETVGDHQLTHVNLENDHSVVINVIFCIVEFIVSICQLYVC